MEQIAKPIVNFLLPYRMFTDDKEFLARNLVRKISVFMGEESVPLLKSVTAYRVMLYQQGYKPVTLSIAEREMQRMLKPVIPNGKCIGCETMFVQTKSKTMLPVVDFQLFF